MADADEDFSGLPLPEKLVHKSWKARQQGYTELAKIFRTLDPTAEAEYKKWLEYIKKMLTDSHLAAQESGVAAVVDYIANAPHAAKISGMVASLAVSNCLSSTRTSTKLKGQELLLMLIEIDRNADTVVEQVICGFDQKAPKNVATCVFVITEALRSFGAKIVNIKPLAKQLPKLFDHKDNLVRSEANKLCIEIYRWIGVAVNSFLADLKPVQIKELQDQFEKLPPGKAVPLRLIRSEQEKVAASGGDIGGEEEVDEEVAGPDEPALDAFDLVDPVNVLDKLPAGFYEQLAHTKWQERKEALEKLVELVNKPKLEDGRYHELVGTLAKRVDKDANIVVAVLCVNCIEYIAKGLRGPFSSYKGVVVGPLLGKLKEKKANVVEALGRALDAAFDTLNGMNEVTEEILSHANDKNPNVRLETLRWLVRCLKKTKAVPAKAEVKSLAEMLVKLLDDSVADIRTVAAEALGLLMRIVGERPLAAFVEKVDELKMTKVKESFQNAETMLVNGALRGKGRVKPAADKPIPAAAASASFAPPPPPSRALPGTRAAAASASGKSALPGARPSVARSGPSAGASASASAGAAKKPAVGGAGASKGKGSASAPIEEIRFKYTDEAAEQWMLGWWDEAKLKECADSAWKVRLAAIQEMLEKVQNSAPGDVEGEAIVRYLMKKLGWKESNFQVMTVMINIMSTIAKLPSFNKSVGSLVIAGLADKLGDLKVKKVAADCLMTMAEFIGLQFVFSEAYEALKKAKSPKTIADALMWMQTCLVEFGMTGISRASLVDFLKTCLGNTNQSVRNNAVIVLGTVRGFVGPDIRGLLQDLNPQTLALVDAEFEKVAARAPPQPTRAQKVEDGAGEEESLDVDISHLLTSKLIEELGDAQWKVRQEALEQVAKILEGQTKVKPNLGELPGALKSRLADSNRNLAVKALEICGTLAAAVGKQFDRAARLLAGPIIACLGDNKVQVRTAALSALDKLAEGVGFDFMLPHAASALSGDQPLLRKDLTKWLGDGFEKGLSGSSVDLSILVASLLACLQDKQADVRKNAQVSLGFVVAKVGYYPVREKCDDMFKGAQLQSVVPILEQYRAVGKPDVPTPQVSLSARSSIAPAAAAIAASGIARPVSKLPAPGAPRSRMGSKTASTIVTKPPPVSDVPDSSFPILTSDRRLKDQRAERDRGMTKWTFEVPRKDLLDFLQEQCEGNLSAGLVGSMFSNDHYKEKDHMTALGDLILKYSTIRFFDTNTSMFMKLLDLLEHLFALLEEEQYHLTEYEAVAFLPFFIQKVGDPKEVLRARVRSIMRQICRVYPPSKFFNYVLAGVESKNSRTRMECMNELALLVQRSGISVCSPAKCFPSIAQQISDRDPGVRNAALSVLTNAYMQIGDLVYKHIGRIPDKDKSLLEEKLKRMPAVPVPAPVRVTTDSTDTPSTPSRLRPTGASGMPTSPRMRREVSPELDMYAADSGFPRRPTSSSSTGSSAASTLTPTTPLNGTGSAFAFTQGSPRQVTFSNEVSVRRVSSASISSIEAPTSVPVEILITQITTGEVPQSIDALKKLEAILSNQPDAVAESIDEIVVAITLRIRITYTESIMSTPAGFRLCKHLVNVLVQIFSDPKLAKSLGEEPLLQCCQQLLTRLLDPSLQTLEQGPHLSRALNLLMVRILDNCDRNKSFSVLLNILETSAHPSRVIAPEDVAAHTKYTDLVMKCLWKITKIIPSLVEMGSLEVNRLLLDVHNFLTSAPPNEWKKRVAQKVVPQADMPLRTVKTILHELINALGENVYDHTTLIQSPEISPAVMYLRQMIESDRKRGIEIAKSNNPLSRGSSSASIAAGSVDSQIQPAMNEPSLALKLMNVRPTPSTNGIDSALNGGGSRTSFAPLPRLGQQQQPQSQTLGSPELAPAVPTGIRSPRSSLLQLEASKGLPAIGPSAISAAAPPLTPDEVETRLKAIFERVSAREYSKQGIQDLYEFQKMYPYSAQEIERHAAKTGIFFSGYIQRVMNQLAAEEREAAMGGGLSGTSGSAMTKRAISLPPTAFGDRTNGENVDGVQDTLARLQKMLHQPGANGEGAESPKPALGRPVTIANTEGIFPMTNGSSTLKAAERQQTVAELKERLAKMKKHTLEESAAPSAV
ncbi:armadillo-type protein [Cladochytrium replicatum]|nr:armadillo-type protein [Cladochytrium replicatum]